MSEAIFSRKHLNTIITVQAYIKTTDGYDEGNNKPTIKMMSPPSSCTVGRILVSNNSLIMETVSSSSSSFSELGMAKITYFGWYVSDWQCPGRCDTETTNSKENIPKL